MSLEFEWDEKKAEENLEKHDIGFDEAKTVFNDSLSITIYDPDHSINEHRYICRLSTLLTPFPQIKMTPPFTYPSSAYFSIYSCCR